jgi:hypothetical protein
MGLIPSFTVLMDIYDVLYLSYLVPEERLRPSVPDAVGFAARSEGRTMLSLVLFHSRNVRASFLPFLHFSYDQANIRTYVLDPLTGAPAVFFLKSGITSRLVSAATGILGVPWQPISMRIEAMPGSGPLREYTAAGRFEGDFRMRLAVGPEPASGMALFRTPEEAVRFLTGPTTGFYGSSGGLVRFEVEHSPISPAMGRLSAIECPVLVNSGLLTDDELRSPHSALIARHGRFKVSMPPARVSI